MAPLIFRRGDSPAVADTAVHQRVGHVYLDVNRRLLHCLNDRARQLQSEGVPFSPADLGRQPLRTPTGDPIGAEDLPLLISWREGRPHEASFVLTREGGAIQHVTWSTSPVKDNEDQVVGVLGSVSCAAPEPDWQTLAGLAHDLRTPLQALKLLLAVLDQAKGLDDHVREVVDRIRNSADRAMLIGLDLLEWCRAPVQKGRRKQVTWCPLPPLLRNLAAEQTVAAQRKKLVLNSQLDAVAGWEVLTEPVRLGRLLSNLLVNAIRYTTTGRVDFTASWQGEGGRRALVLGIIDSGSGISAEEQESIFQAFERGRAGEESGSGGSGLGLAIVDRLVEELGLTLEVYTEYGRGSAFHLLLPGSILRERKE